MAFFMLSLVFFFFFFFFDRQDAFMENYIASQRENIFRNVEVLIYVFDVGSEQIGELLVVATG